MSEARACKTEGENTFVALKWYVAYCSFYCGLVLMSSLSGGIISHWYNVFQNMMILFTSSCLQHWSTLVLRSYVSFSCRCFPDLLARSIHFPLNHLTVGFFSNDSAFTLATNVMFSPAQKNGLLCGSAHYLDLNGLLFKMWHLQLILQLFFYFFFLNVIDTYFRLCAKY